MHKKRQKEKPDWAELDQIEIEPLSNGELEAAFGGYEREIISCSIESCSGGC